MGFSSSINERLLDFDYAGVYILLVGDYHYKIGQSANIWARLSKGMTYIPPDAWLVAVIPIDDEYQRGLKEKLLHQNLAKWRWGQREWFSLHGREKELRKLVERYGGSWVNVELFV